MGKRRNIPEAGVGSEGFVKEHTEAGRMFRRGEVA